MVTEGQPRAGGRGSASRRARVVALLALAIAAAGLAFHALAYRFVCDDAYISFRFSYNFAHHGELVYNLGERVEGYTNFLWTLVIGLLMKVGLAPELTSQVLGIASGVAVLVLLWLLTRLYRGGAPTGWDTLGALLLPTWGGFAVWCSGGLETQLFTALGLGGMLLYLAEQGGRVRGQWSGVVFAFAAMTRPEGLLLFGLTGLHRLVRKLAARELLPNRGEVVWLLGFLVPFGVFFVWRYGYYGYPLPNTFYAKSESGWATVRRWGLPYLWDFVQLNRFYLLAPLLLVFRPRTAGYGVELEAGTSGGLRPRLVWSYVLLVALSYAAYVTYVGGDFMAMGRFFVPVMPLIAFFAQEGLREAVEGYPWFGARRTSRAGWRPLRMAIAAGLVLGAGVVNSSYLYGENQKMPYMRSGMETIAYLKKFADDRLLVGRWMREHLPADTTYSVGGAGASIYASRMKALDVFGLTNEWIAHNVKAGPGGRPGHAKYAPWSYIQREKPDLLCHAGRHQDWLFRPSVADARRWRARGYRWVCLAPPGLRPQYYCCLKRIDRDLGPHLIEADPEPARR